MWKNELNIGREGKGETEKGDKGEDEKLKWRRESEKIRIKEIMK